MTQGTLTEPFFHAGKWYFTGEKVAGEAAERAKKLDCLNEKSMAAAPENKARKKPTRKVE